MKGPLSSPEFTRSQSAMNIMLRVSWRGRHSIWKNLATGYCVILSASEALPERLAANLLSSIQARNHLCRPTKSAQLKGATFVACENEMWYNTMRHSCGASFLLPYRWGFHAWLL
jgi:hypothetical protein